MQWHKTKPPALSTIMTSAVAEDADRKFCYQPNHGSSRNGRDDQDDATTTHLRPNVLSLARTVLFLHAVSSEYRELTVPGKCIRSAPRSRDSRWSAPGPVEVNSSSSIMRLRPNPPLQRRHPRRCSIVALGPRSLSAAAPRTRNQPNETSTAA